MTTGSTEKGWALSRSAFEECRGRRSARWRDAARPRSGPQRFPQLFLKLSLRSRRASSTATECLGPKAVFAHSKAASSVSIRSTISPVKSGCCIDGFCREHHPFGAAKTDVFGQSKRSHTGQEAHVDFRHLKHGIRCSQTQVAGQHQLEASTNGCALYKGHGCLGDLLDASTDLFPLVEAMDVHFFVGVEVAEVHPLRRRRLLLERRREAVDLSSRWSQTLDKS